MDKQAVVEAVNFLIQSENYTKLINEITEVVENWDMYPMAFDGKLKCLNAMIDVGLESREAFENLVKLIESKRKLIPTLKRADYQRDLMRERRARFAKALELHELTKGPLSNTKDRKRVTDELRARWAKARVDYIKGKGNLSWKERNTASGEFWEQVDKTLDKNLKDARKRT
jgi:DNA repair ATPase RecN